MQMAATWANARFVHSANTEKKIGFPLLETSLTICPRLDPSKLTWCLNKIDLCRLLSCLDARKRRTMTICPETNLGGCMYVCRAYVIRDRFTGSRTERAPCEKKGLCTYVCTYVLFHFYVIPNRLGKSVSMHVFHVH